jgi:hypothetical protein
LRRRARGGDVALRVSAFVGDTKMSDSSRDIAAHEGARRSTIGQWRTRVRRSSTRLPSRSTPTSTLSGGTSSVRHPSLGRLQLHRDKLPVGDILVVPYYPDAGSDTAAKLQLLGSLAAKEPATDRS